MTLELIANPDESRTDVYKIARAVYAETAGASLKAVEAMCAMIANCANRTGRRAVDIACDENIMPAQSIASPRHERIEADTESRAFQMCLRVVQRMLRGGLRDITYGATRFHHADELPDWAVARGYIADIDGMLFYL